MQVFPSVLRRAIAGRPGTRSSADAALLDSRLCDLAPLLAEGIARPAVAKTGGGTIPSEIAFVDCTANIFRAALLNQGYIVLRGAIPPAKVAHFRDSFVLPAIAHYARLTEADIAALDPRQMRMPRGDYQQWHVDAGVRAASIVLRPRQSSLFSCLAGYRLSRYAIHTLAGRQLPAHRSDVDRETGHWLGAPDAFPLRSALSPRCQVRDKLLGAARPGRSGSWQSDTGNCNRQYRRDDERPS